MFGSIFYAVFTGIMLFMGFVSKMRGDIANEVWFCSMTLFFLINMLHSMHTKS